MTHCIFPVIVHRPHGMTELTTGQTDNLTYGNRDTHKVTRLSNRERKEKAGQHLGICKDPCLSSHASPTPIQSMTTFCQSCFLNILLMHTPLPQHCSSDHQNFSWATRSLLAGLPAANIAVLWNRRLGLCLLFS